MSAPGSYGDVDALFSRLQGSQIFFCHVNSHSPVRYCRHDLTDRLGPDISDGKDTGDASLGILSSDDVAARIERKLSLHKGCRGLPANADKDAVTRERTERTGLDIFQAETGQFFIVQQLCDRAVPDKGLP